MSEALTYKDAGVDIEEAAALVGDIGELRLRTEAKRQLFQSFGLFAAGFDLSGYDAPVVFTGCDGVGTKLKLLLAHDALEIAGQDLVAMNVNDVLTSGADPIMFLDYIGVGKIDKSKIKRVIAGMVDHLEACGCILAGGETAEMPDMVEEDMIELSGFCIGAAEKRDLIDPSTLAVGDVLIGCASDGFHANGWSLVRRVLDAKSLTYSEEDMHRLLAPTRLYHEECAALKSAGITPKAMAHITGGGLPENLERLLNGKGMRLQLPLWENEPVQRVLNHLEEDEAIRTLNMGFGWVVAVAADRADEALRALPRSHILGEVTSNAAIDVTVRKKG